MCATALSDRTAAAASRDCWRATLHRGLQGCRGADTAKKPPHACARPHLPAQPVPGAVARRACGHGLKRPPCVAGDRTRTRVMLSKIRQMRCAARAFPSNSTKLRTQQNGWNDSCRAGLPPAGVRCLSTAHGVMSSGAVEQRPGARRSMANPYQWLSAAERVRIGTLVAVSTFHS